MGLFGFGKKKDERGSELPAGKEAALGARYAGRPLLLILDNYVADCIGALAAEKQAGLGALVKKAFGGGDDWKKTIRETLKLHDSIDDSIRRAWAEFKKDNPTTSPFVFAAAFSDRHFVPMMEGTPDRGDREENPAHQREAEERKNRSLDILKQRQITFISHLPTIETEATAKLRGAEEVARRATVVALVAAYAEPEGFPREELLALLEKRGVSQELTLKERAFVALEVPSQRERVQFTWRYEALKALMWALGHLPELDYPAAICDVPSLVRLIAQSDPKRFLEEARVRAAREILDEADLIYRYNWACVSARVKSQPAPAGLNAGIVVERHYALNWLIGYGGQDWDNISTDT